jgi:ATP-dependent Clp protease adaptor protein ClpS
MTETEVKAKVQSNIDIEEVPQFYVIMHNDDKTPMDFVIDILHTIFKHEQQLAIDLTMKIHEEGNAIVGMYNQEIAEQKVEDTTQLARSNGFPLTLTIEQA